MANANGNNFLDTDHLISLDMVVQLLNSEIQWCNQYPMAEQVDIKYREGFIAGVEQARNIIVGMAEKIANDD